MQATYHPRNATLPTLKATEFRGSYSVVCKSLYVTLAEVKIDNDPIEQYTVTRRDPESGIQEVGGPRGFHRVNVNRGECTCEGNRRGYLCRHLRLVAKMNERGDV